MVFPVQSFKVLQSSQKTTWLGCHSNSPWTWFVFFFFKKLSYLGFYCYDMTIYMKFIQVDYGLWSKSSNNSCLYSVKAKHSVVVQSWWPKCLSNPCLMLEPQGSPRGLLFFIFHWNSKEVGSITNKGMPQQQDRGTCRWKRVQAANSASFLFLVLLCRLPPESVAQI